MKNFPVKHYNKNMQDKIYPQFQTSFFIFAVLTTIVFGCAASSVAQIPRTEINGAAGSVAFGTNITLLPNGNFVVTDPQFGLGTSQTVNAGAVYLYSSSGTLINRITGATGNDFVGSGGITILSSGDFVISSPRWNKIVSTNTFITGAVTKCSGVTGCSGQISAANSLTGNVDGDYISQVDNSSIYSGVIALPNGNYVVRSPYWGIGGFPNNTLNVGAVTFCNGATNNCAGQAVNSSNSLVGSVAGDSVGSAPVTILSGGDYVVSSPSWKKSSLPAGAVTLCGGASGCTGTVSATNSLTGSVYSSLGGGDGIGSSGIYALPNNLYVVASAGWIKPGPILGVGAVTLCSAITNNCTGQIVTAANSMTGSTGNDNVGNIISVLPNGDYIINSPNWQLSSNANQSVGAVTLCRSAANSCSGQAVSTANSLTSTVPGSLTGFGRITILTNGNYVVSSPNWRPSTNIQSAGAATLCITASNSCAGQAISAANSLVGSQFGDGVSGGVRGTINGITALSNGNYTVSSPSWSNGTTIIGAGAVTFCSGATGCTGAVSAANSLTGSQAVDFIGLDGVTALTGGNYVVNSSNWFAFGTQRGYGAATLCSGNNNCAGQAVSAANSLTGTKADDRVGLNGSVALTNGNYIVVSSQWDASTSMTNVGAVTFCTAANSCANQQVSAANSLIGSATEDNVGATSDISRTQVVALPNGKYLVSSPLWDNGSAVNAGAVTLGDGNIGTVGTITAANSVRSTVANGGSDINFISDSTGNVIIIGLPNDNKVVLIGASSPRRSLFDFDGDAKADVAVFRPSTGAWYLLNSNTGFTGVSFGQNGDKIVPADYDGDGKTDIAVFRLGTWYLQRSAQGFTGISFGVAGDVPVPADFDGDGRADVAVFRPSSGAWYILGSQVGFYGLSFGQNGDRPVAADYDGDGKADIAVFRPSSGVWYLQRSSQGFTGIIFGASSDTPVPADYDGDGKVDVSVFRPSDGTWYMQRSSLGFTGVSFGTATDLPAPADYDGDGKADLAVFRTSSGAWYLQQTTAGFTGIGFGVSGDKPIPNAYVP